MTWLTAFPRHSRRKGGGRQRDTLAPFAATLLRYVITLRYYATLLRYATTTYQDGTDITVNLLRDFSIHTAYNSRPRADDDT